LANNIGALTLTQDSTFDFGLGSSSVIEFGGVVHTAGTSTLAIINWTNTPGVGGAGGDRLLVDGNALTDFYTKFDQNDISFNGQNGYTAIQLVGTDNPVYEIVGLTPIPEPSTYIAGSLAAVGLLAFTHRQRRRRARL
jgi:hypothetical protein